MINEYDKIVSLTESEQVKLGTSFKGLLNTWLQLGMSRYVCRHGTLSEGHEKITPAQRYAQAIREMYSLSGNIQAMKADAMEAQADLIECEEKLQEAEKKSDKLKAEAKLIRAKQRLVNALVTVEDQLRQLDEFNKVREELEPEVLSKYKTIEEAEPDNWKAILKYRVAKNKMKDPNFVCHVPLPKLEKAQLGVQYDAPEAALWCIVDDEKEINDKFQGNIQKFIQAKQGNVISLEDKWQKTTGQHSGPTRE